MSTKLHGLLNLSRIPKDLIVKNKANESCIWIDIYESRFPDKYGTTHCVATYDKANRQNVYLADLKPQEFGQGVQRQAAPANNYRQAPASEPAPAPQSDFDAPKGGEDLPF